MIKFLEITPPDETQFRNSTVVSCEIGEGDEIQSGDTLFTVQNGDETYPLPATLSGKIAELIVEVGDRISSRTSLLLLETEVEDTSDEPVDTVESNDIEETAEEGTPRAESLPTSEQPSAQAELVLDESVGTGDEGSIDNEDSFEDEESIDIVIPDLGGAEEVFKLIVVDVAHHADVEAATA